MKFSLFKTKNRPNTYLLLVSVIVILAAFFISQNGFSLLNNHQEICKNENCANSTLGNRFSIELWVDTSEIGFAANKILAGKWDQFDESFQNSANYVSLDTTSYNDNSRGFSGSVSDGRYIYYIPTGFYAGVYNGQVSRYDTYQPFESEKAWEFVDIAQFNTESVGFGSGVFDGRYIYFIPLYSNSKNRSGQITRLDTQMDFKKSEAWTFYDISSVNSNAQGFWGGVHDGKYIYLVPHNSGGNYSGLIVRFDTNKQFNSSASWEFFDATNLDSEAKGYVGGVFDGQHIYFVPGRIGRDDFTGKVLRFTSDQNFNDKNAWEIMDIQSIDKRAKGYAGAVFDGNYIYFVPLFETGTTYQGFFARYDINKPYLDKASWAFVNVEEFNESARGYVGGAFDGRYIYFSPFRTSTERASDLSGYDPERVSCTADQTGGFSGLIARYDTRQNFSEKSAWSFSDLSKVTEKGKGFWGGLYDGNYVYLTPQKSVCYMASGNVVRIDPVGDRGEYGFAYTNFSQLSSFNSISQGITFNINTDKGKYHVEAPDLLQDKSLNHIVGVYNGSSLKIYINGELTGTNNLIPKEAQVLQNTQANFTKGSSVANLIIFNYALSQSEISNRFNAGRF